MVESLLSLFFPDNLCKNFPDPLGQFNTLGQLYLIIDPAEPFSEKEDYGDQDTRRKQVVMPFTMEDWRVRRIQISGFVSCED